MTQVLRLAVVRDVPSLVAAVRDIEAYLTTKTTDTTDYTCAAAATVAIDPSAGLPLRVSFSGATGTLSIPNGGQDGATMTLCCRNTSGGALVITWPANVTATPTNPGAGTETWCQFLWDSGKTLWRKLSEQNQNT